MTLIDFIPFSRSVLGPMVRHPFFANLCAVSDSIYSSVSLVTASEAQILGEPIFSL